MVLPEPLTLTITEFLIIGFLKIAKDGFQWLMDSAAAYGDIPWVLWELFLKNEESEARLHAWAELW
ncbi:hypothetical protein MMC06_002358 [Schaereria dolodes]|nr:hypothetical protein [Schaereria dolodes]